MLLFDLLFDGLIMWNNCGCRRDETSDIYIFLSNYLMMTMMTSHDSFSYELKDTIRKFKMKDWGSRDFFWLHIPHHHHHISHSCTNNKYLVSSEKSLKISWDMGKMRRKKNTVFVFGQHIFHFSRHIHLVLLFADLF